MAGREDLRVADEIEIVIGLIVRRQPLLEIATAFGMPKETVNAHRAVDPSVCARFRVAKRLRREPAMAAERSRIPI